MTDIFFSHNNSIVMCIGMCILQRAMQELSLLSLEGILFISMHGIVWTMYIHIYI